MIRPETSRRQIDEALLKRCRRGDDDAFETLYARHKDKVFGLLFHLCQEREMAKDMAQQTFLKFFTSIDSFRHEADIGTWLHRIAINTWSDHWRKQKNESWVPFEENIAPEQGSPTPEEETLARQRKEILTREVASLSNTLRPAFLLKYVCELSYQEIAQVLDCSIGTVGSRLNAAVQKLASALQHAEKDRSR